MNYLIVFVLLTTVSSVATHQSRSLGLRRIKREDADDTYRVVCYYTNWAQYRPGDGYYTVDNIDPYLCTHIMYAFAKVEGNSLAPYEANDKAMYDKLKRLQVTNPSLKIVLSIGGATAADAFRRVASTADNRKSFSNDVVTYAHTFEFDGIDIDWEFPETEDRNNFIEMIKALRSEVINNVLSFDLPPLLITCAVGASEKTIVEGYDLKQLAQYVDFVNVMTYDLHGGWDPVTGFQAALYGYTKDDKYSQDWVVNKYLSLGLPGHKLVLGIPTYGRTYTLNDSCQHGVRALADGQGQPGPYTNTPGILAYYEICQNLKDGSWMKSYDVTQHNPYIYKDDQWVAYDDRDTVKEKVAYIMNLSLGGVMFWDLSMDDFRGSCNQAVYPLISQAAGLLPNTTMAPPGGRSRPDLMTSRAVREDQALYINLLLSAVIYIMS